MVRIVGEDLWGAAKDDIVTVSVDGGTVEGCLGVEVMMLVADVLVSLRDRLEVVFKCACPSQVTDKGGFEETTEEECTGAEGEADMGPEHFKDGGLGEEEGAIVGVLDESGDGGFGGDTSETGRVGGALWTDGVAAGAWELAGCGSDKAGGSAGTGLVSFLCLDLGEG